MRVLIQLLRIAIVTGVIVAGMAEALGWSKSLWVGGLVVAGLGGCFEIGLEIYKSRPVFRARRVLAGISEWVLRDPGTYTLTVYQRSPANNTYCPSLRYTRASGLLKAKRFARWRPSLEETPAFDPSDTTTTLGTALSEIGHFFYEDDIPDFSNREQMIRYHVEERGLPDDVVRQFSARAVNIRSVGSVAITGGESHDVIGVLCIDCTDPEGFKRLFRKGPDESEGEMTDLLAFWVDRLAQTLS